MRTYLTGLFLLIACVAFAQQDAMYTHYMFNALGINPAYAGSRDALTVTALHRTQWVGFDGAPVTQTLTLHSPMRSNAVNLGLSVINDHIGPVRSTAFFADYAFRIQLAGTNRLSFGLKAGVNTYRFNLSDLNANDADDPLLGVDESTASPNFGVGIYFANDDFYAGLSVPRILTNDYAYSVSDNRLSRERHHYYLSAGGLLPLTEKITLMPSGLVKITPAAPIQADLTADFLLYERFSIGAAYRSGDAWAALAGVYITKELCVGYSFDWSHTNTTSRYNDGTHEIVLRYDLLRKDRTRIRSPRYF
ncbi:MAG: type IX secretion system membrane protein PorP/SprF [Prevotellaceae bacterium]|jgi:type IX secretion system PorP/SprF family membrane protein|nr:type IX secretion system membrane protein PorP/SprF [Prevotellaceae bacterium]